eukprot:1039015-Prymnesium_polylepis.2
MDVDVVRIGSLKDRVTVDYKTLDSSAVAGVNYCASRGTIVFHPGENFKTISIKIMPAATWTPT